MEFLITLSPLIALNLWWFSITIWLPLTVIWWVGLWWVG